MSTSAPAPINASQPLLNSASTMSRTDDTPSNQTGCCNLKEKISTAKAACAERCQACNERCANCRTKCCTYTLVGSLAGMGACLFIDCCASQCSLKKCGDLLTKQAKAIFADCCHICPDSYFEPRS